MNILGTILMIMIVTLFLAPLLAFFYTGSFTYLIIFLALTLLINFFSDASDNLRSFKQQVIFTFTRFKSWLHTALFKKRKRDRIIPWIILMSLINNFIIEPVTTLSHRIPYGSIQLIPKIYLGKWEREFDDDGYKINIKIYKDKLKSVLIDEDGKSEVLMCKPTHVFYNFQNLKNSYQFKFWYPIINIFSLLLIPETIFGSQQITWECSNSYTIITSEPFKRNISDILSISIYREDGYNFYDEYYRR